MFRTIATTILLLSVAPGCALAGGRNAPTTTYDQLTPAATAGLAAPAVPGAKGNVGLPRFPSISPDGTHVVFSWRGDL